MKLTTSAGEIWLRPYEDRDVEPHGDYLFGSPKEFLEGIGFDTVKLGAREDWVRWVRARRAEFAARGEDWNAVIAEYEGSAVSIVVLDLRNSDGVPRLHYHIFRPELRGKGLGGIIFPAGVRWFAEQYGYDRFLIEPRSSNGPMNALMRKLGYKHLQDYILPAGPITQEMLVSQYEILV